MRLPYEFLTYGSTEVLSRGQVVTIPVKNKIQYGVIDALELNPSFDTDKVKIIHDVLPFALIDNHMKFLFMFAYNTFNTLGLALALFLQPYKILPQRDITNLKKQGLYLNQKTKYTKNNKALYNINYELCHNITFRIRYIIRSFIYPQTPSKKPVTLLFLFSEIKMLERVFNQIIIDNPEYKEYITIYTGTKDKNSKRTVTQLLGLHENNNQPIIIFGLRSALFLPYTELDYIYCIDEGSPYYIQEQNSVYYDARDTVYLLSTAYQTSLLFISTLPSIRLQKLYSEGYSDVAVTNTSSEDQKQLTIKITNPQAKFPKNSLFSEDLSAFLYDISHESEQSTYYDFESPI